MMVPIQRRGVPRFCLLGVCVVLAAAGCHSTHTSTPSTRLASVIVKDRSMAQVESATEAVFQGHAYQAARPGSADLVFEKEGSSMNTLMYGDWTPGKVWVRVKVYLRQLSAPNEILLECDAFMVNNHGDVRFEEEFKLTKMRRGTYQDLLEEVKKRVSQ